MGIYFWRRGPPAGERASTTGPTAIQEAQPADFDWDAIFAGADWFHFTGITPALGPNVVEICKDACRGPRPGESDSCDLNYRGKLWTSGAGPGGHE